MFPIIFNKLNSFSSRKMFARSLVLFNKWRHLWAKCKRNTNTNSIDLNFEDQRAILIKNSKIISRNHVNA